MKKIPVFITALLALGFLFTGANHSLAQYNYNYTAPSTPSTNSVNTPSNTSATQNSTVSTPTVRPATTVIDPNAINPVGVPNTGAGGEAALNWSIIISCLLLAAGGMVYTYRARA